MCKIRAGLFGMDKGTGHRFRPLSREAILVAAAGMAP